MNLHELNVLVNRSTHDRRRAEYMGWTFHRIEATANPHSFGYLVRGHFKCVCGTEEAFTYRVDSVILNACNSLPPEFTDPAMWLRKAGSFSRKHLLADGYTGEQVAEFERKGREFDARQLP